MGPIQIAATHEQRYHDQHLDMDFEHKIAALDTKPLGLTRKEYDLLALLIQNAGEVVTRDMLLLLSLIHISKRYSCCDERSGPFVGRPIIA